MTTLYLRENSYLRAIAFRVLGFSEEVDDVLQSAFCAAWQALPRYRGQASLKTWLAVIVFNQATSTLRSSLRQRRLIVPEADDDVQDRRCEWTCPRPDPEQVLLASRLRLEQLHLLEYLHPDARSVFVLYYSDELPIREIARQIGMSGKGIASVLRRGRLLIRDKAQRLGRGVSASGAADRERWRFDQ